MEWRNDSLIGHYSSCEYVYDRYAGITIVIRTRILYGRQSEALTVQRSKSKEWQNLTKHVYLRLIETTRLLFDPRYHQMITRKYSALIRRRQVFQPVDHHSRAVFRDPYHDQCHTANQKNANEEYFPRKGVNVSAPSLRPRTICK